jgi:hypothetical protein
LDVVKVMNAAYSARCLLELGTDELEETCNVCREHWGRLYSLWRVDRFNLARWPIDVCIELNTLEKKRCAVRRGIGGAFRRAVDCDGNLFLLRGGWN